MSKKKLSDEHLAALKKGRDAWNKKQKRKKEKSGKKPFYEKKK